MPENLPIDDAYIDQVIKANEPYDPNEERTQGVKLRELVKRIRNRIDNQEAGSGVGKLFVYTTSGDGIRNSFSIPHGLDYTPTSVTVTPNSDDASFDNTNLFVYQTSARIVGENVVIFCRRAGSLNGPKAGVNNLSWSILVGGDDQGAVTPNAPTNGVEDLENFTFSFNKNPAFNLQHHEWRYRVENGSFNAWTPTPSLILTLPEANIVAGDVQVRVKSIGVNPASTILSNVLPYSVTQVTMYTLSVNISGLEDDYEVAYNGEVWPNHQKSFVAGTVIENLVPNANDYSFTPLSVSQIIMNEDLVINFTAIFHTSLLNGFTRVVPSSDAFAYQSDFNYASFTIGGGGYPKLGWRIDNNEDGKIFMRYENDSYDLNLYLAFDEGNTDINAVGFYFQNGNITWQYVSGGSYSVGELEPAVVDAYYGLVKVGSNIKLYKTFDGLSFTELYDFGNSRDNYVFITTYSASNNSVLHDPQGVNLVSTVAAKLLSGYEYLDLSKYTGGDGIAQNIGQVWSIASQSGSVGLQPLMKLTAVGASVAFKYTAFHKYITLYIKDNENNFDSGNNSEIRADGMGIVYTTFRNDVADGELLVQPSEGQFITLTRIEDLPDNYHKINVAVLESDGITEVYSKVHLMQYIGEAVIQFSILSTESKLSYPQYKLLTPYGD